MSSGLEELRRCTWERIPVLSIVAIGLAVLYPVAISARGVVLPRSELKLGALTERLLHFSESTTGFRLMPNQ